MLYYGLVFLFFLLFSLINLIHTTSILIVHVVDFFLINWTQILYFLIFGNAIFFTKCPRSVLLFTNKIRYIQLDFFYLFLYLWVDQLGKSNKH